MLSELFGQPLDLPSFFLFITILFCLLPTLYLKQRSQRLLIALEEDTFATNCEIDEVYNIIVNEVEAWRRRALQSKRLTLNPFKWRRPRFAVYGDTKPRLYRVFDRDAGVITFELTPIDAGGTAVKISHSQGGRNRIKTLRTKLPLKVPSTLGRTCQSCKRVYPPTYTNCPYCGIVLQ